MADPLQKVKSGDPLKLSATAWNRFIDTALKVDRQKTSVANDSEPDRRQVGEIWVRNDASGNVNLDALSVVGLRQPLVLPSDSPETFKYGPVVVSASEPTTVNIGDLSHASGRLAVLQEPIAVGKIGRALVVGVTAVKLNVTHDRDEWADVASGVTATLQTGPTGAGRILWKESGTGTKWGVVQLGGAGPNMVWVRVDAARSEAGQYDGTIFVGSALYQSTTPWQNNMAEGGRCRILHYDQVGHAGHLAEVDSTGLNICFCSGQVIGITNDSPPRPLVVVGFMRPIAGSPQLLGATNAWDRESTFFTAYRDTAFEHYVVTDVKAGSSAGQVIVCKRLRYVDSSGRDYAVGPEVETTITIPLV